MLELYVLTEDEQEYLITGRTFQVFFLAPLLTQRSLITTQSSKSTFS